MGILIIALFIVAALATTVCLEWQNYKKKQPRAIIHRVVLTPVYFWYQTYTFSANGQHFSIDASDREEAWRKARNLGMSGLLLVSESERKCEVKYVGGEVL